MPVAATVDRPVAVIGGGPAGLTAAYELVRRGVPVAVFEHHAQLGGLARTIQHDGYRFDIGGHRFFTKVPRVAELWRAMLGPDLLTRPRLSRIHFGGRFFDYPLRPWNVLRGLGPAGAAGVLASYARAKLAPIRPEVSFADWITNRFGRRLYEQFFRTYTEKVWGMPCEAISAEWAAQRIRGLSLRTAVLHMLGAHRRAAPSVRTLIDEFEYPRQGPGMMWDAFGERIRDGGSRIDLRSTVVALAHGGGRIVSLDVEREGFRTAQPVSYVISTMPTRTLISALTPGAPPDVAAAAGRLRYRDFLTVALVLDEADVFPDNWIYVHDPGVKVGRIQNFKNWSPDMVPNASRTCLGLEYFCFEHDGLWDMADRDLVALAAGELEALGLARRDRVVDGVVVRVPKAYPVYDATYRDALGVVRSYLRLFDNLQVIGRNGLHRYNNQDHSMLTAIMAVENMFGAAHDVWSVNADAEYHEEAGSDSGWSAGARAADLEAIAATEPRVPGIVPSRQV
jgi:protoporphyrinogen oxidase